MPDKSSQVLAAWFQFWAEALKNSEDAGGLFQQMNQMPQQQAFQQWMLQFMPNVDMKTAQTATQALGQWTEEWQRTMGIVPRSRYLELLEENDQLRRRLKDAEARIQQLEGYTEQSATTQEAVQQSAEAWQNLFEQMSQSQAEWLKLWSRSQADSAKEE